MTIAGIRILDLEKGIVSIKLSDILKLIENGKNLHWAILFSEVVPKVGQGQFTTDIEKRANNFERGLFISWQELKNFSEKIYQEIDLRIIGCKDKNSLRHYDTDIEMYKMCDIVIEMIDSSYWEVFSKNQAILDKMSKNFKKIKHLCIGPNLGLN